MSVSWSDVICFVRGYRQSNIYWSGDYIADMVKQGKGKKNWYQLMSQIDFILFCVFYVSFYNRIPKRELTITVDEGKLKFNWSEIVDWRVLLPLWFALAIV
jgi:hypothetical protein